jgi:hypothetical protein
MDHPMTPDSDCSYLQLLALQVPPTAAPTASASRCHPLQMPSALLWLATPTLGLRLPRARPTACWQLAMVPIPLTLASRWDRSIVLNSIEVGTGSSLTGRGRFESPQMVFSADCQQGLHGAAIIESVKGSYVDTVSCRQPCLASCLVLIVGMQTGNPAIMVDQL